jgi:hypothetical protein
VCVCVCVCIIRLFGRALTLRAAEAAVDRRIKLIGDL